MFERRNDREAHRDEHIDPIVAHRQRCRHEPAYQAGLSSVLGSGARLAHARAPEQRELRLVMIVFKLAFLMKPQRGERHPLRTLAIASLNDAGATISTWSGTVVSAMQLLSRWLGHCHWPSA